MDMELLWSCSPHSVHHCFNSFPQIYQWQDLNLKLTNWRNRLKKKWGGNFVKTSAKHNLWQEQSVSRVQTGTIYLGSVGEEGLGITVHHKLNTSLWQTAVQWVSTTQDCTNRILVNKKISNPASTSYILLNTFKHPCMDWMLSLKTERDLE